MIVLPEHGRHLFHNGVNPTPSAAPA